MSTTWTPEQITALAPDSASAKAGQGLANARKWVTLGANDAAAWGECQGSGKLPYQTQIDLGEPAFKCSCPSRKFPCKHGLGLFLLLAANDKAFDGKEPPTWVAQWLEERAKKAEAKTEKKEKAPDVEAQAKRALQREQKVAAGLQDLEVWVGDLMRRGLASVQGEGYGFWETPAARLVDAQASGVARLVREAAGVPSSGEGWQGRLLERLSRIHLLAEGYKHLSDLPLDVQCDVRTAIGWTTKEEQIREEPGVRDKWLVLGQRVEEEERFKVQRTWLHGQDTGRSALVLSFAAFGQQLDKSIAPGTMVDAELVFYPSAYPLRAALKERHSATEMLDAMPGHASIEAAGAAYAAALARHVWLEEFPFSLEAVVPVRRGERWLVHDETGYTLPLAAGFGAEWHLMALSGGHAISLFGEWDGDYLMPLAVWNGGRFVGLGDLVGR